MEPSLANVRFRDETGDALAYDIRIPNTFACQSSSKRKGSILKSAQQKSKASENASSSQKKRNIIRKRKHTIVATTIVLLLVILVTLGVGIPTYFAYRSSTSIWPPPDPESPLPPSASKAKFFAKGAVSSDAAECSEIGRTILAKNGSAVDAAVATLFCNGLITMQSHGIGGGLMMTLWHEGSKKGYSMIAREQAPQNISADWFGRDLMYARNARTIAVPGELKGYWEAHKRFGKLPWAEIVQPTIDLCEDGYHMTKHQKDALDFREKELRKDPILAKMFFDPDTGKLYKVGSLIRPEAICSTYRVIADEGGDTLYRGSLAKLLVQDIQSAGGVITLQDLANYQVQWKEPVVAELSGNIKVLTSPLPGCGLLLTFILNVLDGLHFNPEDLTTTEGTVKVFHYLVEALKYAFAKRGRLGDLRFSHGEIEKAVAELSSKEIADNVRYLMRAAYENHTPPSGDPAYYGAEVFAKDDHGTAHLSVMDADGNAVSVTSSIHLYFGSAFTSQQTGILLNNGIDDFSFPNFNNHFKTGWSPVNKLEPGKISLSSMSPTVVIENNQIRMVLGASGGTKIISSLALVIMRHLWFGQDLKTAVDASRIHHQLLPPTLEYEYGILKDVLDGLRALGHNVTMYRERGSIINALSKIDGIIYGNADFRKGGDVAGI